MTAEASMTSGDGTQDLLVAFVPTLLDQSGNLSRLNIGNWVSPEAVEPFPRARNREITLERRKDVLAETPALAPRPLTQSIVQILWHVLDLNSAHGMTLACDKHDQQAMSMIDRAAPAHLSRHPPTRASRLSSPESVWLEAASMRTCVSSPGDARPVKFTALLW